MARRARGSPLWSRRCGRPPFGYPPRLRSGLRQNRAGFLEKREKGRTPSCFGHYEKTSPRYTSWVKWPTRQKRQVGFQNCLIHGILIVWMPRQNPPHPTTVESHPNVEKHDVRDASPSGGPVSAIQHPRLGSLEKTQRSKSKSKSKAAGEGARSVELHGLAFLQALEAASLNSGEMHENVFAILTADKAVAFGVVKPLHCFRREKYQSWMCRRRSFSRYFRFGLPRRVNRSLGGGRLAV